MPLALARDLVPFPENKLRIGTPSYGLVFRSLSIVLGPNAKPNESVRAEAVKSFIRRRMSLQIMTWKFFHLLFVKWKQDDISLYVDLYFMCVWG